MRGPRFFGCSSTSLSEEEAPRMTRIPRIGSSGSSAFIRDIRGEWGDRPQRGQTHVAEPQPNPSHLTGGRRGSRGSRPSSPSALWLGTSAPSGLSAVQLRLLSILRHSGLAGAAATKPNASYRRQRRKRRSIRRSEATTKACMAWYLRHPGYLRFSSDPFQPQITQIAQRRNSLIRVHSRHPR